MEKSKQPSQLLSKYIKWKTSMIADTYYSALRKVRQKTANAWITKLRTCLKTDDNRKQKQKQKRTIIQTVENVFLKAICHRRLD